LILPSIGIEVGVPVGVGVLVFVEVDVGVGVRVFVGVGVLVGVFVGVGVEVLVGVGVFSALIIIGKNNLLLNSWAKTVESPKRINRKTIVIDISNFFRLDIFLPFLQNYLIRQ
jgi:hypothetical protein